MQFFRDSSYLAQFDSSGRLLIGTTTEGYVSADNLTVADAANAGITIRSGTGNLGTLAFSDGTSGAAEYDGYIQYSQDDRYMHFATGGGNIRLSITSGGSVNIGGDYTQTARKFKVTGNSTFDGGIVFTGTLEGSGFAVNGGNVIMPLYLSLIHI